MPLTKLARRYHLQRRPDGEENLDSPSSSVRKVLDFETPEPPPYVTVRKKKKNARVTRPSLDLESLHTTVIESKNYPITDCQGWKRLESTHIDHIANALGHMTIFTEDISAIHLDESFKTALETQDDHAPIVLAEESNEEKCFTPSVMNSSNRAMIAESPSSSFSRVSKWILDSPFQSPRPSPPSLSLMTSDDSDEDSKLSHDTSKALDDHSHPRLEESDKSFNLRKCQSIKNIDGFHCESQIEDSRQKADLSMSPRNCIRIEESPVPKATNDSQKCEEAPKTSNIDGLWQIEASEEIASDSSSLSSSSLSSSSDMAGDKSVQVSLSSSSRHSVSLQVSLTSDDEEEEVEARQSHKISRSPENAPPRLGSNNTLSDVLGDEKRDSQGHVLFLDDGKS